MRRKIEATEKPVYTFFGMVKDGETTAHLWPACCNEEGETFGVPRCLCGQEMTQEEWNPIDFKSVNHNFFRFLFPESTDKFTVYFWCDVCVSRWQKSGGEEGYFSQAGTTE